MDLRDKSILVVGANGSLAKETIKWLVRDGASKITMACRSKSKAELAKQEILSESSSGSTVISAFGGFDMNKPDMVRKAVDSIPSEPFDIVFLAAGFAVFSKDYQVVEWNGKRVEKNVFQNMIGSHITFSLLLEKSLISEGARVVIAGGEGARGIKGMIDCPSFEAASDLVNYIYLNDVPKYNPMNAIGISKLCGALWTAKIANLGLNMEILWFSPGLTSGSEGLKDLPALKRWFMSKILFGIFGLLGQAQSPKVGGRKFADCLEGQIGENGDLLGAPKGKAIGKITDQTSLSPALSDEDLIDAFWRVLEEVTGRFYGAG